ncbi:hypothetical protein FBR05_15030 [Deltaproteobacteria bacterium PRO3]|nr:hypothetical protein [Deltaproteobacteria bacterium PRO3]
MGEGEHKVRPYNSARNAPSTRSWAAAPPGPAPSFSCGASPSRPATPPPSSPWGSRAASFA